MTTHAIQTGSVRIKTAQVQGRRRGLRRRLAVFADHDWTEWLPTYAWVIDHPEGVIVVDTGQGTHLLESGKSLHPLYAISQFERPTLKGPRCPSLAGGSEKSSRWSTASTIGDFYRCPTTLAGMRRSEGDK